jgi:MerR family copper efflux transcriptional regulator
VPAQLSEPQVPTLSTEPDSASSDQPATPLLRIQEVAAEAGLTTRSVRYYEEIGLLKPAGRSGGAYRLYDADDIERLRFIKGLRDDAGFSLAEIGQLLEDEEVRVRNRERRQATSDPKEQRALIEDSLVRIDRQVANLRSKLARIEEMVAEAEARRAHLRTHLEEVDARAGASKKISRTTPDGGTR